MRPRVFPAEDERAEQREDEADPASMRPRVFPAEDPPQRTSCSCFRRDASMRPRVFPAEDYHTMKSKVR